MNILVLGDEMVDRYWIGTSRRLNPDGPQPLVSVLNVQENPGGAGNVAKNLELFGANVFLASTDRGKIVKNRVLCDGKVVLRFDEDSPLRPLGTKYDFDVLAKLRSWDAVVVSDYNKGSIDDVVASWVQMQKLPTFVDCKVRVDRWLGWADWMFPNLSEFEKEDYSSAKAILLKQGSMGAEIRVRDGSVTRIYRAPAYSTDPINPTGAGDTVMAAFVVAYLTLGKDYLGDCLEFSMQASALAVAGQMTYAGTIGEIIRRFKLPSDSPAARVDKAMKQMQVIGIAK